MREYIITPEVLRGRAMENFKAAKAGLIVGVGSIAASFLEHNPVQELNRYGAVAALTLAASFGARALGERREASDLEASQNYPGNKYQ